MLTPATAPRQSPARTAAAGVIGNILEWFDYGVFGAFAGAIGAHFFPKSNPTAQMLGAYVIFAVGFFARPIGGLVLGRVGDRIGRRSLLTVSIAVMGAATLLIGLLPTHDQIGVGAPILLVVLRIIQGFSLGGEFTGSMVYTTELSSPLWRGLLSSSTAAGTTMGFLLGSLTSWIVEKQLGEVATKDWGWRIPFIASVVLCILGWFLRRGITETEEGQKVAGTRPPIWQSIRKDWRPMVQTFGILGLTNAAYYLLNNFATEHRKASAVDDAGRAAFQLANVISLIFILISKPLGGWLSDHIGRRRLMIILTVLQLALMYFTMKMMLYGSLGEFQVGQILLGVVVGMALGLQGAMLVEIFPLRTRVMSMSFAYSVTLALSGGVAPLVSTWLLDNWHEPMAPAYYAMVYGVIGLAIMIPMRETNKNSLAE